MVTCFTGRGLVPLEARSSTRSRLTSIQPSRLAFSFASSMASIEFLMASAMAMYQCFGLPMLRNRPPSSISNGTEFSIGAATLSVVAVEGCMSVPLSSSRMPRFNRTIGHRQDRSRRRGNRPISEVLAQLCEDLLLQLLVERLQDLDPVAVDGARGHVLSRLELPRDRELAGVGPHYRHFL